MKEMVGGCCVCSDERGWTENPLVYCDGQGCTVAVHQACYGIVSVPSGPWYCRKCESQERAARLRCELCPSKDGALKRTDNSGWAHVVCALYIPEVRFGNVTTMEPIILSMVPPDRFSKGCYICETHGRESKSKIGACMQCNKSGCKHHFHVTCAQALGLLCEEAGNYMDNVKYCGYCQHHYSKLKRGANLKTIPAFKPLPAAGSGKDSIMDKLNSSSSHPDSLAWSELQPPLSGSSNGGKDKQKKKAGRKPANSAANLISPKSGNSRDTVVSSVIVERSSQLAEDAEAAKQPSSKSESINPFADVLAGVGLVPGPRLATSESSSGSSSVDNNKTELSEDVEGSKTAGGKKKTSVEVGGGGNEPAVINDKNRPFRRRSHMRPMTPNSAGGNDTESTLSNISDSGMNLDVESTDKKGTTVKIECPTDNETVPSVIVLAQSDASVPTSQVESSLSVAHPSNQRTVSPIIITSAGASSNHALSEDSKLGSYELNSLNPGKESSGGGPVLLQVKKGRRGRTPKSALQPVAPESPPSSPDSGGDNPAKRRKKSNKSVDPSGADVAQSMAKIDPINNDNYPTDLDGEQQQQQPEGKQSSIGSKENQLLHSIRNGMNVPHMLGNQLNPTSSMAQKMTDTLTAEVEAHSIFSHNLPSNSSLVGVPFPRREASPSTKMSSSTASAVFPQSLEQLLERQWEQGSQFLMEQAQNFDIASLLSCLHNLRQENMRLEDHVASLNRRREHLLAVNARLSIPLSVQPSSHSYSGNSASLSDRSTPGVTCSVPAVNVSPHRGTPYLPLVENGLPESLTAYLGTSFSSGAHSSHRSPLASANTGDRVVPSPVIVSSRNMSVLRSPCSTPEMRSDGVRSAGTPSHQYQVYQMVSPPLPAASHHAGSHAVNATTAGANQQRREQQQHSRPSPIERR